VSGHEMEKARLRIHVLFNSLF